MSSKQACPDTEQLSAYLDGELTQQQAQQVEHHLQDCESCQAQLAQLEQLSAALQHEGQRFKQVQFNAFADSHERSDWLVKLTWLLLLLGGLPLLGYSLYLHWQSFAELEWWLAAALGSLLGGFILAFVVVLRERLSARKTDKFRKVQR